LVWRWIKTLCDFILNDDSDEQDGAEQEKALYKLGKAERVSLIATSKKLLTT